MNEEKLKNVRNKIAKLMEKEHELETLAKLDRNSSSVGKYFKQEIIDDFGEDPSWWSYLFVREILEEGWLVGTSFVKEFGRISIMENDSRQNVDGCIEITKEEYFSTFNDLIKSIKF